MTSPAREELGPKEIAARLECGKPERTGRFNHNLTHEQILRFGARRGFHASRQYRQERLRRKAIKLKELGLLEGGRGDRYGDGLHFRTTKLGLQVLGHLEARSRNTRKEGKKS